MGPSDELDGLISRHGALAPCREAIWSAFGLISGCYASGGKLLVCGNGGSAADGEHIVGELMKGFKLGRGVAGGVAGRLAELYGDEGRRIAGTLQGALPAISLVGQVALNTAFANDVSPEMAFAQAVYGLGREGDVILAISTSGNARNVLCALRTARAVGMRTVGLTGAAGGGMAGLCDAAIKAPETETYKVQELHLPIYHALCAMLELEFFGG